MTIPAGYIDQVDELAGRIFAIFMELPEARDIRDPWDLFKLPAPWNASLTRGLDELTAASAGVALSMARRRWKDQVAETKKDPDPSPK